MDFERILLIKSKTRLEQLIERYNSKAQARFYITHNGGDFSDYEQEHNTFYDGLNQVQKKLTQTLNTTLIEKSFLSSFIFAETDLVVVVGQDGLVANTAKYVGSNPVLAINPDPQRNKGTLLPFNIANFETQLRKLLKNQANVKQVTMAEAALNDGQKLLAFNDFFVGKSNHTSARYRITYEQNTETHSSSGLVVSTGAGSTGWLSSILNELSGLNAFFGGVNQPASHQMGMEDNSLCFVVREPFQSPYTSTGIVAGAIRDSQKLKLESQMPENGVIFSDGVLEDFLEFNSGKMVSIGVAAQKAHLVC